MEKMKLHSHFVAETKGSMSTLELRVIEKKKIECAKKFFEEINRRINPKHVKYDVVTSYERQFRRKSGGQFIVDIFGASGRTEKQGDFFVASK